MTYSSTVLADSPALYWRLGEASGTTAADSSGSGNTGTYSNVTLGTAGALFGDSDTAATFNGFTSVVSSTFRATGGTSYTVEAWVKTSNAGSAIRHVAGWRASVTTSNMGYIYVEDNVPKFAAINTSNTFSIVAGSATINDDQWHHLVGMVDGSTLRLYVDGTQVATAAMSGTPRTTAAGDGFLVGTDAISSRDFTGAIDEVAEYPSALSAARVLAHYTAGTSAPLLTVTLAGQVQPVTAAVSVVGVSDVTLAGQVAPVTAAVSAAVLVDVALAGQVAAVTADVQLEAVPDEVDVDLAGQVAPVAADIQIAAFAAPMEIALAGQVGAVAVAVVVEVTDAVPVSAVDTNDRLSGRNRSGYAVAEWEPAVVQPPSGVIAQGHRRIRAAAFGELTSVLPPTYATSEATALRLRTRVMVGGKDISFHGGIPTPEPEYQLAEPLLWGPSSVEIPSIPAAFFDPADYPWLAKGKTVTYQRVTADGTKVGVDYRGVVIAYDISGRNLRLEVGGHGQGRAALRHKPLPIFRDTLDLGRLAWAAVRDLGLRFSPRLGPTTGIRQALFGGMDHLSYISEVCAKAFDTDGQWSLMPDDSGAYSFARKDRNTVHWTLFNDDARVVADLRSDAAEEPNRVFAGGVTPKGQRVRNGVYPGLKPGPAAPYPFNDDRTFGLGTLDAETDTGDGIAVMLRKMWVSKLISLEEMDGQYDATVTRALMAFQDGAGLPVTGNMTPATWDALFDIGTTGFSVRGAQIVPMAQDYRVRRYDRSGSDQVLGRNPNFDPSRLIVDREIDFGSGFTRDRMRDWARSEVYRGEDNWFGTITIHTGGILIGDVAIGATITDADIADVRDIRPGHNVRLPMLGGGILLHISGVEISRGESGHPVARLTVDTQARDALPVWEQIRRNRETRRDAGRRWKGNRASTEVKDSIDVWDEVGGVLYGDVDLEPGWNVIPVVAGQEGTVSRLRLVVQDVTEEEGEIVIQGREFACAVFGKRVTPKRLRTLIGNPLAASPNSTAEPEPTEVDPPADDPEADSDNPGLSITPARPWWERQTVVSALRDLDILYAEGTHEDPCGYSPGKKSTSGTVANRTGLHTSDSGFSYRTRNEPVLYVAVWVWGDRRLLGGRIMWNQLEAGA